MIHYRWHVSSIFDVRIDVEQGRAWVMDYPAENAVFGESKQREREVEVGSVILDGRIANMRQLVWWKATGKTVASREVTFIDPDAPFRYSIKNLKKVGKWERTKWAAPKEEISDRDTLTEFKVNIPFKSLEELKRDRERLKRQTNSLAPAKLLWVEKAIAALVYKAGKQDRLKQRRIERGQAKKVKNATNHT